MFREPLSIKEVERDTKSAERYYIEKKYKYTNERLIELLEITEYEQQNLKRIIGQKEKYRRNNERRKDTRTNEKGQTKRDIEKIEKIKVIKELFKKGYKQKDIARELNVTKGTVSKYLKINL